MASDSSILVGYKDVLTDLVQIRGAIRDQHTLSQIAHSNSTFKCNLTAFHLRYQPVMYLAKPYNNSITHSRFHISSGISSSSQHGLE